MFKKKKKREKAKKRQERDEMHKKPDQCSSSMQTLENRPSPIRSMPCASPKVEVASSFFLSLLSSFLFFFMFQRCLAVFNDLFDIVGAGTDGKYRQDGWYRFGGLDGAR